MEIGIQSRIRNSVVLQSFAMECPVFLYRVA